MAETSEFRTTLENFTGPLDLLLYLIRKDEIDILDIPIAMILEQYEHYVQFLADIDVNLAADYLVMATTLMEIKSRMLLPQGADTPDGEELEDPRSELVKQLLEYRTYKERALYLASLLEEESRRYKRTSSEVPFPLDHVELGKLSLWDVVTAFMRIQKAIAANRPAEIVYTERPLSFYMDAIQETFTAAGARTVPFEDIFLRRGPLDRFTLVGTFLAILEFVKLGALALDRDETTGGIVVILRIASLSDSMQALAAHANVRETSPETPHEPELEPETREALTQLDAAAAVEDETPLRTESADDIVLRFDAGRDEESAAGDGVRPFDDVIPEEPDDPTPDRSDSEADGADEAEKPCA